MTFAFPSLDTISSVASDISAAAGFGSFAPVILGPFSFEAFEVPEQIRFGSKLLHNVHTRPGGQRQIDVLGPEPHDISWSGQFIGGDASSRAQELHAQSRQGMPATLTWGDYSFRVLISNLDLDYKRSTWVTYSITCCVMQANPKKASTGLLSSLTKDLGDALGIDINGTLKGVNSALKQITPLVSAVSTLTGGSPWANKILGAVNSTRGVVGGLSSVANGNVFGLAAVASTFTGNSKIVAGLGALGAAVNDAPKLIGIDNKLGVMSKNLTNVSAT